MKNVTPDSWSLASASDTRLYSYPAGHAPVAYSSPWPAQGAIGYLPIIPDGREFGMNTIAGFGSTVRGQPFNVYFIDSLETVSSGGRSYGGVPNVAGSLQWCLSQPGPRVVLSTLSGMINYSSPDGGQNPTYINALGNTTLALHTAPSPGMFLAGCLLSTAGDDVLLWHVGVFSKDLAVESREDCYRITSSNVVMSNCSGGYSGDEILELYSGTFSNITILQCLFHEAVQASPVNASYGPLVGSTYTSVSFLRNVSLLNRERNPLLRSPSLTIADSMCYNAQSAAYAGVGCALQSETGFSGS